GAAAPVGHVGYAEALLVRVGDDREGAVAALAGGRVPDEPVALVGPIGGRVAGRVAGPRLVVEFARADVDGDPLAGDGRLAGGRRIQVHHLIQARLLDVRQHAGQNRV